MMKTHLKFLETSIELQCDSESLQYKSCAAGGNVADVTLMKQDSNTTCTKGENFGISGSNIWVDKGCRGHFIVILGGKFILNVPYNIYA